jgi:GrpB-like predicted nucleotidyltransferase (UPF0157 family)
MISFRDMDEIEIVEPDPRWPEMFRVEAAQLRRALDPALVIDIEHFGSTAIAGLAAKPIIDILITVRSIAAARSAIAPLLALGYVFWEDNPRKDRMFFVKGMPPHGTRRTHHVHIMEPGDELQRQLLFRDYLRAHSDEAQRYEALKRDLAQRHRHDREAYTNAKDDYAAAITAKARRIGIPAASSVRPAGRGR